MHVIDGPSLFVACVLYVPVAFGLLALRDLTRRIWP
jgi:hypothetical protein